MEVAWQVIVDGNLDNTDMDYSGRFAASTCYNSEKAVDLGGMMRNERDWVVVFDIPRIEAEIKAKRFVTLGDSKVPVVDGRRKDGKDSPVTRYIPVPKNPHGLNTSPDGKYFIANGKLSPTCTMIAIERLGDLFAGKLADPRDVVVGEPELGLGPLHTTFDGRGNAYTTLFIDSQLVKWNLADAVRAYKGERSTTSARNSTCSTSRGTTTPPCARPAKPTASGSWCSASSPRTASCPPVRCTRRTTS